MEHKAEINVSPASSQPYSSLSSSINPPPKPDSRNTLSYSNAHLSKGETYTFLKEKHSFFFLD